MCETGIIKECPSVCVLLPGEQQPPLAALSFLKGVTVLPQRSCIQDKSDLPYLLGPDLPFRILLLHLVSEMDARYCSPAGSSSWNSAANQRLRQWENENKVNFPLGLKNTRSTLTPFEISFPEK